MVFLFFFFRLCSFHFFYLNYIEKVTLKMLIKDTYKRYFLRHKSLKKNRKFTCIKKQKQT